MKIQREHIGTPNKLRVISTNGTHGAHQGFSVEPGESYTFEIDLHRPAGMNKEINVVIWKNTGPSGAYTLHVLNTDGSNTFNYTATSSNIYIQIRQAGTYYLDNIRMYRTYEDTVFVRGYEVDRAYRYGFNTQERVDEVSGKGNHYTAEFWEYDPRVVHRWNLDPKPVPSISPYAINQGNPIWFSDPLGDTVRISSENQKYFMEDLETVYGELAHYYFSFDEENNLQLSYVGNYILNEVLDINNNKKLKTLNQLHQGVMKLVNSEEITNIYYIENGSFFNNPETGNPLVTESGEKINNKINSYGGEATITLTDVENLKIKDVTQNHIFISKDKVHSPGEYDDPRENNTFHGMGHVLFQKVSEQEKVIDFDNVSRSVTGATKRPIDPGHRNK